MTRADAERTEPMQSYAPAVDGRPSAAWIARGVGLVEVGRARGGEARRSTVTPSAASRRARARGLDAHRRGVLVEAGDAARAPATAGAERTGDRAALQPPVRGRRRRSSTMPAMPTMLRMIARSPPSGRDAARRGRRTTRRLLDAITRSGNPPGQRDAVQSQPNGSKPLRGRGTRSGWREGWLRCTRILGVSTPFSPNSNTSSVRRSSATLDGCATSSSTSTASRAMRHDARSM